MLKTIYILFYKHPFHEYCLFFKTNNSSSLKIKISNNDSKRTVVLRFIRDSLRHACKLQRTCNHTCFECGQVYFLKKGAANFRAKSNSSHSTIFNYFNNHVYKNATKWKTKDHFSDVLFRGLCSVAIYYVYNEKSGYLIK